MICSMVWVYDVAISVADSWSRCSRLLPSLRCVYLYIRFVHRCFGKQHLAAAAIFYLLLISCCRCQCERVPLFSIQYSGSTNCTVVSHSTHDITSSISLRPLPSHTWTTGPPAHSQTSPRHAHPRLDDCAVSLLANQAFATTNNLINHSNQAYHKPYWQRSQPSDHPTDDIKPPFSDATA